jgi:hypothetical protein
MRGRILLGGLVLAAALSVSSEASACVWLPVTYSGRPPSEREMAAERAREARVQVRRRHPGAQAALAGGIDAPAELARMLVPNIRPVPIERSDCGPENEIDPGEGEEKIEDWLAGTYLVRYSNEFAHMVWSYRGETLGPACNAEFRERFAAHLRGRLDAPAGARELSLPGGALVRIGAARLAPGLVRGQPPPAAAGALEHLLQAGDRTLDAPHRGGPGTAARGG